MMIIPEGFCQINFRYINGENEHGGEWTFAAEIGLHDDPTEVANIMKAAYVDANFPAFQCPTWGVREVAVKFGPNITGPSGVSSGSVVAGTESGSSVPANTAVIVRKVTAAGGRAGRGRFYFPGIAENRVDGGGNIDGTYVDGLQTACGTFLADMVAAGLPPVLLHAAGSPITDPTPITALTVLSRCGTQRDRMR
jgi:hypothetical protein